MTDQACLLAAIADDFSGGSDLAGMFYEGGASVVQIFGLPDAKFVDGLKGRFAVVVLSLKSRSIPADEACAQSLRALESLERLRPRQMQFKFCSTFDSTSKGNIGPVTEALLGRLGQKFTVAVPALPVNRRTQYMGHLFVGSQLLSESSLRHHPLNPMTQPNLVAHLQSQMNGRVGLIDLHAVRRGVEAIRLAMAEQERAGNAVALVDATEDSDLAVIAQACQDLKLITAGSGLATALAAIWKHDGLMPSEPSKTSVSKRDGASLILSGSCSAATLDQLQVLRESGCPMLPVPSDRLPSSEWLNQARETMLLQGRLAVFSSAPSELRTTTPEFFERAFAAIATALAPDAARIIVAGGETSGAVVEALQLQAVEITGILDPGVPMLRTLGDPSLALALKSGNFGSRDFFAKALQRL